MLLLDLKELRTGKRSYPPKLTAASFMDTQSAVTRYPTEDDRQVNSRHTAEYYFTLKRGVFWLLPQHTGSGDFVSHRIS